MRLCLRAPVQHEKLQMRQRSSQRRMRTGWRNTQATGLRGNIADMARSAFNRKLYLKQEGAISDIQLHGCAEDGTERVLVWGELDAVT